MNPFQKKSPPPLSTTQVDLDAIHVERTDMYIVAALMNVYNEALRRRGNRVLWTANDVDRFLSMARALLAIDTDTRSDKPPARSWNPTEAERENLLNMFTGEHTAESTDEVEPTNTDESKPEEVKARRRVGV